MALQSLFATLIFITFYFISICLYLKFLTLRETNPFKLLKIDTIYCSITSLPLFKIDFIMLCFLKNILCVSYMTSLYLERMCFILQVNLFWAWHHPPLITATTNINTHIFWSLKIAWSM